MMVCVHPPCYAHVALAAATDWRSTKLRSGFDTVIFDRQPNVAVPDLSTIRADRVEALLLLQAPSNTTSGLETAPGRVSGPDNHRTPPPRIANACVCRHRGEPCERPLTGRAPSSAPSAKPTSQKAR